MLPLTLVQVVFSFASGIIASRTGDYKWNLMAGFFIWTIGMGLMSTLGAETPKANGYGYQILVAVGAGQTFQTSLLSIQASVARKDMATATGCRNFLRMLGGTVVLAACTAILNNVVRTRLSSSGLTADLVSKILSDPTELVLLGLDAAQMATVRAAYAKGINACFILCVPFTGLSFFITLFWVQRVSLKRDDDVKLKAEGKAWVAAQKEKKHGGKKSGANGEDHHSDDDVDGHTIRDTASVSEMTGAKRTRSASAVTSPSPPVG